MNHATPLFVPSPSPHLEREVHSTVALWTVYAGRCPDDSRDEDPYMRLLAAMSASYIGLNGVTKVSKAVFTKFYEGSINVKVKAVKTIEIG